MSKNGTVLWLNSQSVTSTVLLYVPKTIPKKFGKLFNRCPPLKRLFYRCLRMSVGKIPSWLQFDCNWWCPIYHGPCHFHLRSLEWALLTLGSLVYDLYLSPTYSSLGPIGFFSECYYKYYSRMSYIISLVLEPFCIQLFFVLFHLFSFFLEGGCSIISFLLFLSKNKERYSIFFKLNDFVPKLQAFVK